MPEIADLLTHFLVRAAIPAILFGQHSPAVAFDVASIKIAIPSSANPRFADAQDRMIDQAPIGYLPMQSGRVHIRDLSLSSLVAIACRIRRRDIIGPAWLADQRFDIDAVLPKDVPPERANEMLRSLLHERFGLRLHKERRQVNGFALRIGKGGFRLHERAANPADARQDRVRETPARLNKESVPEGSHSTFLSGSLSDLADILSLYTSGPVLDMAGIRGRYDFVLDREPGPDSPALFESVRSFGLKLEPRKLPRDLIVIDAINRRPT
jgi:uncharacterized protein (TIGR03435 family)